MSLKPIKMNVKIQECFLKHLYMNANVLAAAKKCLVGIFDFTPLHRALPDTSPQGEAKAGER